MEILTNPEIISDKKKWNQDNKSRPQEIKDMIEFKAIDTLRIMFQSKRIEFSWLNRD